jgi:hypothetical protein
VSSKNKRDEDEAWDEGIDAAVATKVTKVNSITRLISIYFMAVSNSFHLYYNH